MFGLSDISADPLNSVDSSILTSLQDILEVDADGLIGKSTVSAVQRYLYTNQKAVWNPFSGDVEYFGSESDLNDLYYVVWNGLNIPIRSKFPILTFESEAGLNLHNAGNFSTKKRAINSIIVHWGGLNPHHLHRVFSNRSASSHFGVGLAENTTNVAIYQYLDLAHIAWHAVGSNTNSIGIDICQQPESKYFGYYKKNGYNVSMIDNPAKGYGPSKIVSLDTGIRDATVDLLQGLSEAFLIDENYYRVEKGLLSKEESQESGIYSHFQVDFKKQGKWDVAPWWNDILDCMEENLT